MHKFVDEILVLGLDDWIQASEIASLAKTIGGALTTEEVRELSLKCVTFLLEQELMEIGAVTEAGFKPWAIPIVDSLARVEREWSALPNGPSLGDIFWLSLTSKGHKMASDVWMRRSK